MSRRAPSSFSPSPRASPALRLETDFEEPYETTLEMLNTEITHLDARQQELINGRAKLVTRRDNVRGKLQDMRSRREPPPRYGQLAGTRAVEETDVVATTISARTHTQLASTSSQRRSASRNVPFTNRTGEAITPASGRSSNAQEGSSQPYNSSSSSRALHEQTPAIAVRENPRQETPFHNPAPPRNSTPNVVEPPSSVLNAVVATPLRWSSYLLVPVGPFLRFVLLLLQLFRIALTILFVVITLYLWIIFFVTRVGGRQFLDSRLGYDICIIGEYDICNFLQSSSVTETVEVETTGEVGVSDNPEVLDPNKIWMSSPYLH